MTFRASLRGFSIPKIAMPSWRKLERRGTPMSKRAIKWVSAEVIQVTRDVTSKVINKSGASHTQDLPAGVAWERSDYRIDENGTVSVLLFNGERVTEIPADAVAVSLGGIPFTGEDDDGNEKSEEA